MTSDGEKLLEAAGNGSVEAFESLTGSYMKTVYNIMLAHCGKSDEASKLAQEVFVRVFKNIKSVRSTNLIGFKLYKTAGDVCRDFSAAIRKIS